MHTLTQINKINFDNQFRLLYRTEQTVASQFGREARRTNRHEYSTEKNISIYYRAKKRQKMILLSQIMSN